MDPLAQVLESIGQFIAAHWAMIIAIAAIAANFAAWQVNVLRDRKTLIEIAHLRDEVAENGRSRIPFAELRQIKQFASDDLPPIDLLSRLRSFLLPQERTQGPFPLSSEDAAAFASALTSIEDQLPSDPFFLHFEGTIIKTTLFVGAIVIANGLARTIGKSTWSQAISDLSVLILTAIYTLSWANGYRRRNNELS